MKKVNLFLAFTLLIMTGCAEGSKQMADDLVIVDVTASYPKKEFKLQDIMDVEYIVLDSSDEFICGGEVKDIDENIIVVTNQSNDGDIFLFDRNGKGLRKINRKGQGPEEYNYIGSITLDEDNNEMIVSNLNRQIIVYNLNGDFIRNIKLDDRYNTNGIKNFNREYLMCIHFSMPIGTNPSFFIISKQDGSIINTIEMPYKELIGNSIIVEGSPFGRMPVVGYPCEVFCYNDNWVLAHSSSDTIFTYSNDHKMTPVIARTPSIQSMNPETFLVRYMFSGNYYFMESVKKAYNADTKQFPTKQLMYDRNEKMVFEYTLNNDDYSDNSITLSQRQSINSGNRKIASFMKYEAYELVEANKEGKLKGRLKEIASKLKDDDNPVIMLIKHKKVYSYETR